MKKTLLVSTLLISLMLIVVPIGHGANPGLPPPDGLEYGQYVGPDVTGTATFEYIPGYGVNISFDGMCKNDIIIYFHAGPVGGTDPGFFQIISPDWLLGTCDDPLQCNGIAQPLPFVENYTNCSSKNKDAFPYPFVYKVINFYIEGNTKKAVIVGRFPVLVPTK